MVVQTIRESIETALGKLKIEPVSFTVEHPSDVSHGDYATNVALVAAKQRGEDPRELAEKVVVALRQAQGDLTLEKVEVAGPGFINFHLAPAFFSQTLAKIGRAGVDFGRNERLVGQKVLVEYTDPNPFKEFHIGHLMSNAIGESISRLIAFSGAEVRRANYQGDVGVHVAKAIWGKRKEPSAPWGKAYALGAQAYEEHKEEIDALNKKIYERSDEEINELYDDGRKETLEEFEALYAALGTKFDEYFFESEAASAGGALVRSRLGEVFAESEGAVVFPEERSNLHTRVFLNSQGLPTYEAKELALAKLKYERYPYEKSIVITGNEINEYFKVVHRAMELVYPELAAKTEHLSHGMLRLLSGKMSSRTGDVITARSLIDEVKERVLTRMEEPDERVATQVAVGAIKYMILKQTPGKNIIFDVEQSLSLEGDSGPYLQYTYVRALSVLKKAQKDDVRPTTDGQRPEVSLVEQLLYRFPEVVLEASREYSPHKVVHFLTSLAGAFNASYAREKIVDGGDATSPYKVALTSATATVLGNGLSLLGIATPERM